MMGPIKITLPFSLKTPVLALGAQTKNTVCFAERNTASVSEVHRDLSDPEDFAHFERAVRAFLKKRPRSIAIDTHPEYVSTKYAHALFDARYTLRAIQHHHAHIASCMADYGLRNEAVIGVAFDGTGMGADGTLWGGEFFVCDYRTCKRQAHLKAIPLLGGERAILEPWRVALFWLDQAFGEKLWRLKIDFIKKIPRDKWQVLKQMSRAGFNAPLSSSVGRLFDAAASIVLAKPFARHEAALAIELEKTASGFRGQAEAYQFKMVKIKAGCMIDPLSLFRQLVEEVRNKVPQGEIAYRFHLTVARMIQRTCALLAKKTGIKKVAVSGGVFQNTLLLDLVSDLLYREDLQLISHRRLSCNDSGIALGEAVIAGLLQRG